jgi:hypothetical protein
MQADATKYSPKGTVLSLPFQAGWFSADMFLAALQKTGKDLTVDSLVKTLNDGWTYNLPGALAEVRFPVNHVVGTPCGSVVQLQGAKWVQVVKLSCGQIVPLK